MFCIRVFLSANSTKIMPMKIFLMLMVLARKYINIFYKEFYKVNPLSPVKLEAREELFAIALKKVSKTQL